MSAPTVALCGAGLIAGAHVAAAAALELPVVAVASRTPQRAAKLAASARARAVGYDDLPAGADVVVVATPPQCHAADAVRMLESGAAVLLEKPLCRTLEEADLIVSAAARHHGRLLYAENLAYAPVIEALLALVPRVGPLTFVGVRSLQELPAWGDFTSDEWGGGALFDLGVHPLAVAVLVAGAAGHGRPTAVQATLRGSERHGSDEHADVRLHFASGLRAEVVASWQAGPGQDWAVQVAGQDGVVRAELFPAIRLEVDGHEVAVARDPLAARSPHPLIDSLGYIGQLRALVDDVAAGREPAMSAAFGRDVLDIVLAAYASAGRDGKPIQLPFSGPRDRTPLQLWRGD